MPFQPIEPPSWEYSNQPCQLCEEQDAVVFVRGTVNDEPFDAEFCAKCARQLPLAMENLVNVALGHPERVVRLRPGSDSRG